MSIKDIPLKLKISAIICFIIFLGCIIGTILVSSKYNGLENNYNIIKSEESNIKARIKEENEKFYAEMLKNGIDKDLVSPIIQGLYKYKLYVNGYIIDDEDIFNNSGVVISSNNCTIKIEEFFDESALDKIPLSIMQEYSYLRTKGSGSSNYTENTDQMAAISELLTYTNTGFTVTEERECLDMKTSIIIKYKDLVSPYNIFNIFLDNNLRAKLNLTTSSFEVRYL